MADDARKESHTTAADQPLSSSLSNEDLLTFITDTHRNVVFYIF